jgi:hypothetical protein
MWKFRVCGLLCAPTLHPILLGFEDVGSRVCAPELQSFTIFSQVNFMPTALSDQEKVKNTHLFQVLIHLRLVGDLNPKH